MSARTTEERVAVLEQRMDGMEAWLSKVDARVWAILIVCLTTALMVAGQLILKGV